MLFGYGSKGIRITFHLYAKKLDWWIYCSYLYEFGIENSVITKLNHHPFKSSTYETRKELNYYWLDLIRLVLSFGVSIALLWGVFKKHGCTLTTVIVQETAFHTCCLICWTT
jgi:hypothetical protein